MYLGFFLFLKKKSTLIGIKCRHICKFRGVEIIYLTTSEWPRPPRAQLSGPWGDRRSEDENTVNSTTRRSDELWFSFLLRQAGTLHRCGSHLGWFGSFPHLSFWLMSKYHIHLVGRVGNNICFKQLTTTNKFEFFFHLSVF